jgi:hypothetical protein
MDPFPWKDYTNRELRQAEAARLAGNEGRARVCARRAAGHIIGEYLRRKGSASPSESAYARIHYLASQPGLSIEVYEKLAHLTMRISPEHTLPVEADLIADVRVLAKKLLGEAL